MGFIAKAISSVIGGGKPKSQAAPAAPVKTTAEIAAEQAATPAAQEAAAAEDARKRLLAINAGAVQGQLTGPGGDLSKPTTTRKMLLGL